MITVCQDLCHKRDRMDRLKIAFSLVANAALGAGSAYLLGGDKGGLLYGAFVWGEIFSPSHSRGNPKNAYPIPDDTKKLLADFAERAKMEIPPLEISDDPLEGIGTNGHTIKTGFHFLEKTDKECLGAIFGHELGHIKRKDAAFRRLSWIFLGTTLLSNVGVMTLGFVLPQTQTTPAPSLTSTLLTTVSAMTLQWLIDRWRNKITEFRADRFELQHSRSPLALAEWLQESSLKDKGQYEIGESGEMVFSKPAWNEIKKPSLWLRLISSHPDTHDRIKALVQLCKRMPDSPAEKPPEFSL